MELIDGLSRLSKGNDVISLIVDLLTKSCHFMLVKEIYSMDKFMWSILFVRMLCQLLFYWIEISS